MAHQKKLLIKIIPRSLYELVVSSDKKVFNLIVYKGPCQTNWDGRQYLKKNFGVSHVYIIYFSLQNNLYPKF